MLEPQPDDVEESVTCSCETVISVAAGVTAELFAFGLFCLMNGALSRFFDNFPQPPPSCFIFSKHSVLLFSITCAVLAVALCLRELKDDSRTGVSDDRENESINQVHNDIEEACNSPKKDIEEACDESLLIRGDDISVGQMDSTWWADGGVCWAGAVCASPAGVQVGGESHHRKNEREREVEMSGKAVSGGKGKNA